MKGQNDGLLRAYNSERSLCFNRNVEAESVTIGQNRASMLRPPPPKTTVWVVTWLPNQGKCVGVFSSKKKAKKYVKEKYSSIHLKYRRSLQDLIDNYWSLSEDGGSSQLDITEEEVDPAVSD